MLLAIGIWATAHSEPLRQRCARVPAVPQLHRMPSALICLFYILMSIVLQCTSTYMCSSAQGVPCCLNSPHVSCVRVSSICINCHTRVFSTQTRTRTRTPLSIAVGSLIFLIGLCGCLGAFCENQLLLAVVSNAPSPLALFSMSIKG